MHHCTDAELKRLQDELVFLQLWVKAQKLKVNVARSRLVAGACSAAFPLSPLTPARHHPRQMLVIFEGRDAAGKGGVIKRITEPLNHRGLRVAALSAPTEQERSQWYFQRYVQHLPSGGEIVLFDRSWYNRAGERPV
jgi:polyphosphate kinase 2 (PPK2 family)